MIGVVKKLIPRLVKQKIAAYQAKRDKDRLFGALAPLVPAVDEMFDGPQSLEEFKANGDEFLGIYKEIANLRPDERMLDVGSGIGRKTLPLTQYLSDRATYEGIDITKAGVDWCRERITPRFPNFRFQQIDVYNKHYNPTGQCRPSEYRFPFVDQTFDFVMLGSVFTHMLPADLENYLSEVSRVLARNGRCLITYFLLNEESERLIAAGRSTLDFEHDHGAYRTVSLEKPELAVAFDEGWIKSRYGSVGLRIKRVELGSWCGRRDYLSYQDLILAKKE
jgi:SAM-dependent methyltransferase